MATQERALDVWAYGCTGLALRLCREEEKQRRARSRALILEERKKIPILKLGEISKRCVEAWNALSDEEKREWILRCEKVV